MDGNKNILFLRIVIVVYYFHFKMSTHNRARIFDYEPTSFKVGSIKMVLVFAGKVMKTAGHVQK